MTDVFTSYSRDDRARVALISKALEAEGLSVWWDPEIQPGSTFDEVIEREIADAKSVVVVWSNRSVQSRWVRSEASEGDDREILVPIKIDDVRLPIAFKLIQTEDFTGWQGDRNADAWQRIMLQLRALTGKEVVDQPGASITPLQGRTTGAVAQTVPPQATSESGGTGIGMLTISAAVILGAIWIYGTQQHSSLLTGTVALAALAFLLFRFAESDLRPGLKAIASRWFLPVEGKVQISTVEAFNNMFKAVFGRKHLYWKCVWRSALASTLALLVLIAVLDLSFQSGEFMQALSRDASGFLMFVILVLLLANILGDYFSLWETRLLLRFSVKRPWFLLPVVVLDAVLTPIIFLAAFLAMVGTPELLGVRLPIKPDNIGDERSIAFLASIATAYITSVWLWLALIFAPIARLLVWSRTKGLTAVGRLLDVQRKPFTALGYVTALLILFIGASIWGINQAVAAWS